MIRHVVAWTLKGSTPEEKAERARAVVDALLSLEGKVPSLRGLSAGANVAFPEQNADVAIVADFEDVQGLEEYQVHPEHVAVAAIVREHVSARTAVDFEF